MRVPFLLILLACALHGASGLEVVAGQGDLTVIKAHFTIDDGIVHLAVGDERLPLDTSGKILRSFWDSHRPVANLVMFETAQPHSIAQLALIFDQMPRTFYLYDIIVDGKSRVKDVVEHVERGRKAQP